MSYGTESTCYLTTTRAKIPAEHENTPSRTTRTSHPGQQGRVTRDNKSESPGTTRASHPGQQNRVLGEDKSHVHKEELLPSAQTGNTTTPTSLRQPKNLPDRRRIHDAPTRQIPLCCLNKKATAMPVPHTHLLFSFYRTPI